MPKKLINVCTCSLLLLKAAIEEVFQRGRNPTWVLRRLGGVCNRMQHFKQSNFPLAVHPGRLLLDHLVDSATQAPNICKPIMTGLLDHLRCHPVWRTTETLRRCLCLLNDLLTGAEICELACAIIPDQNVGCLNVTMYDIVVVEVFKAEQNLLRIRRHALLIDVKLFVVGFEGATSNVFKEDIQILAALVSSKEFDNVFVL